jgi:Membrane domain of glycerophosphoryl diester phosphodiesterase
MADEGTPVEPPRFPPVDDADNGPPSWPPVAPPGPPTWPPDYTPPPFGPPGYAYGQHAYGSPYGGRRPHWLHPLTIGKALGSGWRLFRFNWRPMVGLLLLVTIPFGIVSALYTAYVEGPALAAWQDAYQAAILNGDFSKIPPAPASSAGSLLISLIAAVLSIAATAAVVHIIGAAYRGTKETAGTGFRAALKRIGTLIGGTLLLLVAFIGVAIVAALAAGVTFAIGFAIGGRGLGFFIALIGAVGAVAALIFFALRWSMFLQAMVLERLGAMAALGRSWRLVSGSTWRVLGYFLVVFLILFGIELVVGIPLAIVGLLVHMGTTHSTGLNGIIAASTDPLYLLILTLGGAVISAFFTPWFLSVLTLLYYDLRWQRGELDATEPAATTAASPGAPLG